MPSYLPADIEAEAQHQKTTLLYRNAGVAQLVNVVNASLLAYVVTTLHASAGVAFAWWCLIFAVTAGRHLLVRRFLADRLAATARAWRHRYIGATALAAAAWAAGSILFMWDAPDEARLFTGLVLSGMVAGAVPVLAPVPAAFRVYALTIGLPLTAVILLQADSPLHWAFGAMSIVFLAAVLVSARRLHESLDVAIRLGLEKSGAEATLRASEERYRLILQHSPTGILHFNKDLIVTYCNDRLAQIIQASVERLIGLPQPRNFATSSRYHSRVY